MKCFFAFSSSPKSNVGVTKIHPLRYWRGFPQPPNDRPYFHPIYCKTTSSMWLSSLAGFVILSVSPVFLFTFAISLHPNFIHPPPTSIQRHLRAPYFIHPSLMNYIYGAKLLHPCEKDGLWWYPESKTWTLFFLRNSRFGEAATVFLTTWLVLS